MDLHTTPKPGWIEVITGSMFSGKSEELIRRLRRAQIAKRKVQIFKPKVDDRYCEDHTEKRFVFFDSSWSSWLKGRGWM